MTPSSLQTLAAEVGIEVNWRDVHGVMQTVDGDGLKIVLRTMGLPADTDAQTQESLLANRHDRTSKPPKMITAQQGETFAWHGLRGRYSVQLESGGIIQGSVSEQGEIPAIHELGYHRLEVNDQQITIAVAPPRAYTLSDAAQGGKLWGLAVQLYALRREGDGGIGDFAALADFVRRVAAQGADAVAISPVHALFESDARRFGPYAPSNRAALNIMHIPETTTFPEASDLIDWPAAGAAKRAALRSSFKTFNDFAALDQFRRERGVGLERHALFEAIQSVLGGNPAFGRDWRVWPEGYRHPNGNLAQQFLQRNAEEVTYHAYLQFRAEESLGAAQNAGLDAGMKIGLIADLAVGTDPMGSHSWSHQEEVLNNLEIGAPPDAINREGQSWGITAFSPRGLRESGFSGFIEMLRHTLRHAGGVRIDHVMGLSRLWVIPHGFPSSAGMYLRMPEQDLLRLIMLESQRHKAVILGEDLGTLPDGFQERLNDAGIAGLRVMWFEKSGEQFRPPSSWTKSAVAMTSTHDLPTVAGWWHGKDISWRETLGMAGDDVATRENERRALWSAFHEAGVSIPDIPSEDSASAAVDAACKFLGASASILALLPIEDAIAAIEQPNLPGTIDEHPNWRRRLPEDAQTLLARPDVSARLALLKKARAG